jgi:hypothetical protein
LEPEEEESKKKYNKNMIRAKRIISYYIKYHLIPQMSSKNSTKDMFDALTKMYEGNTLTGR